MSGGVDPAHGAMDETSSSQGLSSPPSANSPSQFDGPPFDDIHPTSLSRALQTTNHNHDGSSTIKREKPATAKTPGLIKRPRKKREMDATTSHAASNGSAGDKPKKVRAARGTSAAFLKKQARLRDEEEQRARQVKEALHMPSTQSQPQSKYHSTDPAPGPSLPTTSNYKIFAAQSPHQNGNHEAIQKPYTPYAPSINPVPRPASGQNYDPIRSATVAPRPVSPLPSSLSTPPKLVKPSSASASPSISSLIDPPEVKRPYEYHPHSRHNSDVRAATPPDAKRQRLTPPTHHAYALQRQSLPQQQQQETRVKQSLNPGHSAYDRPPTAPPTTSTPMDVDSEPSMSTSKPAQPQEHQIQQGAPRKTTPNASTAVSSTAHSPKPSRPAKDPSLALPTAGSGLLSGSVFGAGDGGLIGGGGISAVDKKAPTVVLEIKLSGENQYVNFARLAEERYGFDALHPRLAAQRERLARVAAAGAALENAKKLGAGAGSGLSGGEDDKSVDLSNDEADDSNVEMGGMNDGAAAKSEQENAAADANGPPVKQRRKRIMKEDMYDKDDDFVDDTELAWEEQAAVSKDGFFVYSGLLVPEGEDAKVERYVLPTPQTLLILSLKPIVPLSPPFTPFSPCFQFHRL